MMFVVMVYYTYLDRMYFSLSNKTFFICINLKLKNLLIKNIFLSLLFIEQGYLC